MKKLTSLPLKQREIIADAALERYVRTSQMVLELTTEHGRVTSPDYLRWAKMTKTEMAAFLEEHKETILAMSETVRDALLFYNRQVNPSLGAAEKKQPAVKEA
jgi:hypothetical protein